MLESTNYLCFIEMRQNQIQLTITQIYSLFTTIFIKTHTIYRTQNRSEFTEWNNEWNRVKFLEKKTFFK